MRPESSAASWVKFFTAAGINTESAEHYAVTFSKNQIQLDMLPEINKDYLNDMGISLLGHIIAILRHAKTVYADEVRKSELPPAKKSAVNGPKEKSAVKSSKPTTKPVEQASKYTTEQVKKTTTTATSSVAGKRKSAVIQLSPSEGLEPKSKVRKKLCDSSDDVTPVIKPVTNSKSDDSEEIKKGVFRRLGSEVIPTSTISDNFPQANGTNESVFSRLGGKSSAPQVAKVAALNTTKRILGNKIDDIMNKSAATKSIMRTRLDKTKKRILVAPTYMDSVMEERKPQLQPKVIRNSFRSASAALQEKKDIKTRLGSPSSQLVSSQYQGNVKKVSFGCVFEKLIPRVKKPGLRSTPLSVNSGPLNVPVSSLISQRLTRPIGTAKTISVATSSGVFSRLGR